MAAAKRKIGYYVDELPDNGNPKNFKAFIKEEELNELKYELENSPKVLSVFSNMNENILNFNYDEFHLYFKVLENMMSNSNPSFEKHMKWFGDNLNYEQLFIIQNTYPLIKVDIYGFAYINENNKELKFNFFK